MVSQGSPKPLSWVRFLPPLPKKRIWLLSDSFLFGGVVGIEGSEKSRAGAGLEERSYQQKIRNAAAAVIRALKGR